MIAMKVTDKNLVQFSRVKGGMQPSPQSNNQRPLWVGCCRLSNIAVTLRVRVGTPAEVPKKINSMSSSRFKKYSG
jgi:hypothetical protein